MDARIYQAETMSDALAEVKRELGRDAMILGTRRIRRGGLLGLIGGHRLWEIRAASHLTAPEGEWVGRYVEPPAIESAEAAEQQTAVALAEPPAAAQPVAAEPVSQMALRMQEIQGMVQRLLDRPPGGDDGLEPPLASLKKRLLRQDVDPSLASQLIYELKLSLPGGDLPQEDILRRRLVGQLVRRLRVAEPAQQRTGRPRVVALIGPTGVGKTTTIAKLAAGAKLRQGKKVALVTIDSYRIAAVDQLRTYARIIDVPLQAVLTPGELHQAVSGLGEADLVLIDTAGRSQNDQMRLDDLRKFLAAAECDEVHLVLSAAANPRVARAAAERFGPLGANRIIVTKLDEAATFGIILNLAAATEAAVSFVTTGQDVPDDIASPSEQALAECIVRGSWDAK